MRLSPACPLVTPEAAAADILCPVCSPRVHGKGMECPRMEPHRIRPPVGNLGGSGGGQGALSSGETNQARIPSSPSALGDLGSHQFPSWPSPQSTVKASAPPTLALPRGRGWRKCWPRSGLGETLPCRLWVGVTHIPPLFWKLPASRQTVLGQAFAPAAPSAWTSFLPFLPICTHWLPPAGTRWHHFKEGNRSILGMGWDLTLSLSLFL